jgi:hypothetical protein
MKPGIKRVNHYSQEQRDLSIKTATPAPKVRKARQASRRTRKQQELDPAVGAVVLLFIIAVALIFVWSTR